MLRLFAPIGVILLIGLPAKCNDDPDPEPGQDCSAATPGDTSMLPERIAELGSIDNDTFHAYATGETIPLVFGLQGFAMITSSIALPADVADVDDSCWHVELRHIGNDYEDIGYSSGMLFSRVGDMMRAGPIFDVSGADYAGQAITMEITVATADWVAVDTVDVQIEDY